MLDFGDLPVMTKADAEAIDFVVCNDGPHSRSRSPPLPPGRPVHALSNFVAGTDMPDVNVVIANKQDQSRVALIALASDCAREARQAKDVRVMVIERGAVRDLALA